jgi:hypothetical protein
MKKSPTDDRSKLLFGRGYYVDFTQFARLLNITKDESSVARSSTALAAGLGVPPSKAQGLVNLARGFDLLERRVFRPTPLGYLIAEHDPYFDALGTLWFLHFIVASEPRQLVWNRFANVIVPQMRRFTLQEFRDAFADQRASHTEYTASDHVQKETLTVIDAYMNKQFSQLAYLRADGKSYSLGSREPVPPLILAATIVRFRDRHRPGDTAIPVTDLLTAPNSPGVILQLREELLRAALEELRARPGLALESRADLDQVRLSETMRDYEWLERHYVDR